MKRHGLIQSILTFTVFGMLIVVFTSLFPSGLRRLGVTFVISLVYVCLYVLCWEYSRRASDALAALPYSAEPDLRRLIPLSLRIALPLYFCLFCTALIPIWRWEVWLLTGMPIICLICIPLLSVMEELKDRRFSRRLFWGIQLLVIAALYLSGQGAIQLVMRLFLSGR